MKELIIDKCIGCGNIEMEFCRVYVYPAARWSAGNCPKNTHIKKAVEEQKKALDPIKASKRKMGK